MNRIIGHWQRGSLIGVLLLVLVGGGLLFGALFGRDHGRGPMMKTWQNDGVTSSVAPAMPAMDVMSTPSDIGGGMLMKGTPGRTMMPYPQDQSAGGPDQKVVTNASLDLRVQNIDWTIGKVSELVLAKGGYISTVNRNQPKEGQHSAWMVVKVPSKDFYPTYDEIKKNLYYITNENLSGENVTQSYNDLQARLKNKQEEENTLKNLLTGATKIEDVIQVTDRLTQVRSEIESLEAQQRMLDNQTEMATVSISMTEDPQITADTSEFRGGSVFKRAVSELYQSLLHMGAGLVIVLITGIPIIIVYLVLLWVVYFFTKRGVKKFFDR